MNRAQKAEFVEDFHSVVREAPLVVLTEFKGSTVAEMNALRRACEPLGIQYRVVKNTLAVRALEGTEKTGLADHFVGNVGVFISGEDAVGAAKLLKDQLKSNEKLQVKAGFFDGAVLDQSGVVKVADLPSKEELLVTLLRTLQEGPRQMLGVLQAPARDLLYLLQNYARKLEESGAE